MSLHRRVKTVLNSTHINLHDRHFNMTLNTRTTTSSDPLELLGAGTHFHDEFCGMLESSQMFNDLEWSEIEALSNYMKGYRVREGATLFREGENGNYMCLVIDGRVDVHKENRDFEDKIVTSIDSGKTLGEMAMVDGEPRSATAIAATETTLAILTRDSFNRLIKEKPALGVKILMKISRLLSQRLRRTCGILVDYLED